MQQMTSDRNGTGIEPASEILTSLAALIDKQSPERSVERFLDLLNRCWSGVQFQHGPVNQQQGAEPHVELGELRHKALVAYGSIDKLSEHDATLVSCSVQIVEGLLAPVAAPPSSIEALQSFAGGVAAHFNNLHTSILGHGALLLPELDDPSLRAHVEPIMRAGRAAASLSSQLLAFAGRGRCRRRRIDAHELITRAASTIQLSYGSRIQVELELEAPLPYVEGDPVQLEEMLLNLATNARDAMPLGGTLTLRTKQLELSATSPLCSAGTLQPGPHIRIQAQDSGCGMPRDVLARVLEPFFSTKSRRTSPGMGLPAACGVALSHGGVLGVASLPGVGTTVEIYIPLAPREHMLFELNPPIPLTLPGKRILTVDGNRDILDLLKHTLSQVGYVVEAYTDILTALERYADVAVPFDLVVLDLSLPSLEDVKAIEAFLAIVPDAGLIITTGSDLEVASDWLPRAPNAVILLKPFTPAQLSQTVLETLLMAPHSTLSDVAPASPRGHTSDSHQSDDELRMSARPERR